MSIFKAIGSFLAKEVKNVEATIKTIYSEIQNDVPKVETIIAAAIADYKTLKALATSPDVEAAIQAVAILIADIEAL